VLYDRPPPLSVLTHIKANSILERHLIVSDRVYSMSDLKNMSIATDALILNTVRDQLKLRISEHDKRKLYIYFLARPLYFSSFYVLLPLRQIYLLTFHIRILP
jgi:hypothetical protein